MDRQIKLLLDQACELIKRDKSADLVSVAWVREYENLKAISNNTPVSEVIRDAKRWDALLNSGRIRIIGSGGLGTEHQHFGVELWDSYDKKYGADLEQAEGKQVLEKYVDTIIARKVIG